MQGQSKERNSNGDAMNCFKGIRNAILPSLLLWALITYGCAGVGTFTPKGAEVATNAVSVATGLLHVLDGFYGGLLDLKQAPDYTIEVTRALSIADAAAAVLKEVVRKNTAGEPVTITNEQLNVVAGQVDGAKAILNLIRLAR
jgi:hypothetical protein